MVTSFLVVYNFILPVCPEDTLIQVIPGKEC